MLFSLLLWADGDAPVAPPKPDAPNPFFNPMTILLGLFLLFWLMVIRPSMRRQEKERQSLLTTLDKNDEILTIGGIYATVVSVNKESDDMIVRVEDNVRMKMTRSSIARNLTKEKERQAQQQAAADAKK